MVFSCPSRFVWIALCYSIVFTFSNAWGLRESPNNPPQRDVIIADSCGQTAFEAAGSHVCKDPRFDTIMPVAILWINCKYAGAGIRQLTCDGIASNAIVPGGELLHACLAELSSNAFLHVLQYTMSAFEACEQTASSHSAASLRKSVTFLVEEAKKSADLQEATRLFLEDMLEKSVNLAEAERRLEISSSEVSVASVAALSSSKALMLKLEAALKESEQNSEEMQKIDDAMRHTFSNVVDATLRLSEDLEIVMVGVEENAALTFQIGKSNVFENVLAVAVVNGIFVSVYDAFHKRGDNVVALMSLTPLVRLASTLLCIGTITVGRSVLVFGPRALANYILSVAVCTGISLWDCLRIRREFCRLRRQNQAVDHSGWSTQTHALPTDSCEGTELGVEAFSFEPCERNGRNQIYEERDAVCSTSSSASWIQSKPISCGEMSFLKQDPSRSETPSTESSSLLKSTPMYLSTHAYVEDSPPS